MLESETQEMLLIDFDFTYWKRCNFLTSTSRYGKFNQENVPNFIRIGLQNANAKFHKVGKRHYSGETENVAVDVHISSVNPKMIFAVSKLWTALTIFVKL